MATPSKYAEAVRPKSFENSNPNFTTPGYIHRPKSPQLPAARNPSPIIATENVTNSPQLDKSSRKFQKSAARNPNPSPIFATPRCRIRERKFVVAKKKSQNTNAAKDSDCKCRGKSKSKCSCVAYETLRSSQEGFWKGQGFEFGQNETRSVSEAANSEPEQAESPNGVIGNSSIKRRRDKLMEEARESIPATGSGRVLHLVQAFEKLLTLPKSLENSEENGERMDEMKGMKWALPGLQMAKGHESVESPSEFCNEGEVMSAESLGFVSPVASSFDCSHGSSRRSSCGSSGSRRSSSLSLKNVAGKKLRLKKQTQCKVTSQKPFKLRTEERGKEKEEEFFKKLQEMTIQEEKQRLRIAQGLPWTTDEPEILVKPSVKDITRPADIKLHTDMRAVERADFDYQVAEKMCLIEQYKMEKERQQKLSEEEEIKRLRKGLVPKAQPMPYFDRPFLPKRSVKQPTIPRDPKLQLNKKMKPCLSWNEFSHIDAQQQ